MADKDQNVAPLLDLLERRFAVRLTEAASLDRHAQHPSDDWAAHWRDVQRHYQEKRALLRVQLGEAAALGSPDYAKAFLISEAARLMILREIQPRPKKRKKP